MLARAGVARIMAALMIFVCNIVIFRLILSTAYVRLSIMKTHTSSAAGNGSKGAGMAVTAVAAAGAENVVVRRADVAPAEMAGDGGERAGAEKDLTVVGTAV